MSVNAWIVVGDQPAIGNLITVARSLGGPVGAVVAGPRSVAETVAASGVDKVVWCGTPDDVPAEANAPAVAETVAADPPRVVLGGRNPGERVLLGAAAARLKAAVLTGARSVALDGDGVIVVNAVFGDISEETVAVSGPVALLLDGGSVPPPGGDHRAHRGGHRHAAGPEGDRDQDVRLRRGGPQRGPPGDRRRPRPQGPGGPRPHRGRWPTRSAPRSPVPARWPKA